MYMALRNESTKKFLPLLVQGRSVFLSWDPGSRSRRWSVAWTQRCGRPSRTYSPDDEVWKAYTIPSWHLDPEVDLIGC